MFHSARPYRNRSNNRFRQGNGCEVLERRDMLSGTPPTVTNVAVASTSWSPAFIGYLQTTGQGTNGYSIPKGSTAQSATLTWNNINQIALTFSKDVHVDAADLSVSGVNVVSYAMSNFHYDPQTLVATWTLSTTINKDRLRLDLDTNGSDPVRDLEQNVLDGEWTNNVSTVSGNGTAGGDFEFNFNVLPADVNNTSNITAIDYTYVRQLDGKSISSSGYIAKRDLDGSGVIDSTDWQDALNRGGQVLPTGSPAGTNNDAPTTNGFSLVEINDDAIDVAISLASHFGDTEDGGSGLTYSIISNSNSSLFDTAAINQSTKEFVLNAAGGASGRATFMMRAMDAGGLFVDTPITVDVMRTNAAPEIRNFIPSYVGGDTWILSGDVVDADDDVSNFIVEFTGVVTTRSAVDENGHFEFAVIIDDDNWGWEYAITYDPHGAASNEPFTDIGLT